MDEFFAAVEKLDHPEYRGRPLLVGGDPRARGVVSTASYEARPFGCRSGMAMSQAVRLCPQALVLHANQAVASPGVAASRTAAPSASTRRT